ncbi:MAG: hypothetical protein ACTSWA_11030 [Candidatus Thorarchaeota archaeon]
MQEILGIPIPYMVLVLEIFIVIVLVIGWIYGARRKDFNLHHKTVWLVALLHILTVGFWMIPRALERLSFMLANPIANWYQILHDIIGILAIGLGILLVLLFLFKKGMPSKLLKQTRPIMFLTIGTWIIALILGIYWFLLAWVIV